jgi:hypothetical protein
MTNTRKILSIVVITVIAVLVIGIMLWTSQHNQNNQKKVTPSFETVQPSGKTVDQVGGWSLVSPENSAPVYAYADMIDGVKITVSEQMLPGEFKDNTPSKVEELAKKFNATTKLEGDKSQIFYLGTSAKGPQSVILAKNNLLILIKSDKNIADSAWKKYINSLN